MAGKSGAKQFSESDKARILVALAANDGNIKRTARDESVAPATIRRWRDQQKRASHGVGAPAASPAAMTQATGVFVVDAERIRNKALSLLERRVDTGDIKTSELNNLFGTLTDKIDRANGLPTSRHEHVTALPKPEELRELMQSYAGELVAAAGTRHEEILEAEVVEVDELALPQTT